MVRRRTRLFRGVTAEHSVRVGFVLLAVLTAVALLRFGETLPWILLVVLLDLLVTSYAAFPGTRSHVVLGSLIGLLSASAAAAGIAFALVGPSAAPLILVPAYHAGVLIGRRTIPFVAGTGAVASTVALALHHGTARALAGELAWLVAAIVIGLLGALSHQLAAVGRTPRDERAAEAIVLLRRLTTVAASMETGFDAPSAATTTLERLAEQVPSDRSAALWLPERDRVIPLAVLGSTRVPWGTATEPGSVLHEAWQATAAMTGVWDGDLGHRYVVTAPVTDVDDERLGMVVADRADKPFTDEEVRAFADAAHHLGPLVDAARLFGELRSQAVLEERARLARDMHDGVAQELAVLGFRIDVLRSHVTEADPALRAELEEVGKAVRSTLMTVRMRISDLRMVERPDTSLGAIIGSSIQELGVLTGIRTTYALSETTYRFPADTEMTIHRLVHDVIADARHSDDATELEVRLDLAAPALDVLARHDGTTRLTASRFADETLTSRGAEITFDQADGRAPVLHVTLVNPAPHPPATVSLEVAPCR